MRLPRTCHRWNLSPRQAVAVQRRLAGRVVAEGSVESVRTIAGLDAAFSQDGVFCVGAVVLWDRASHEVLETQIAWRQLRFPYVPGLLSFREVPVLLLALRRLRRTPDLLMCDGQGKAHPRRFGLGCHVGVLTGLPTVGCAKSLLVGSHGVLGEGRGCVTDLEHGGEVIGRLVRTRSGVRPMVISVGHRVGLDEAVALVLECARDYRLPEPTRLADRLCGVARSQRLPSVG